MSLYQFIQSRIAMGRMLPVAVSRVNRAIRLMSREDGLLLCRPNDTGESAGRRNGVLTAGQVHFKDASALVNMFHRHHAAPVGHLFSGAVYDGDVMCAAVIVGRPVSRMLDNGSTIELVRVVTDGTRNAASKVMAWAIAEAKRRNYARAITYTLLEESGASLRAVGFVPTTRTPGGSWDTPSRRRQQGRHPTGPKQRWEIDLKPKRKEVKAKNLRV